MSLTSCHQTIYGHTTAATGENRDHLPPICLEQIKNVHKMFIITENFAIDDDDQMLVSHGNKMKI